MGTAKFAKHASKHEAGDAPHKIFGELGVGSRLYDLISSSRNPALHKVCSSYIFST